jgi:Nucleotidyl transferase AbiEii toxin, Type IV TA system
MSESAERHLLRGVLRRWARSTQSEAFVLRGGVLTQHYVGAERRPTRDLDFLGLFPRDPTDTRDRIEDILSVAEPDGITLHLDTLVGEVIWQETPFPGLRYRLDAEASGEALPLQIDVGFGDPLVPPAVWIDYPPRVLAASPELLVAWKLDGLLDHGAKRWQAKDVYDLHLLTTQCQLDPAALAGGIRVALETHGNSHAGVRAMLDDPAWWESPRSRAKWEKFRKAIAVEVPEDLAGIAAGVAARVFPSGAA